MGFFGIILALGTSASTVLHLPHFPFRHLHQILQLVRCHHQLVQHLGSEFSLDLRAHCSATLVSRLLSVVHIIGFCGFHFSGRVEIEKVLVERNWDELVLSIPAHQFLKMSSHSLTNFAVIRDHVSTVMSQIQILSSFARDLCSAAQHLVCTSESSVQRSEQTVFIVSLKLPNSTIKNPFITGSPIESSISCSFWTQVQWDCVHCSSCVQVHLHHSNRFRLLTTPRSNLQVKMSLRNCQTFVPNLRAIHPTPVISFNMTPASIPFVRNPAIMKPRIVSGTRPCRFLSF